MQTTLDVRDHGAKGDGRTDDSAAFRAALREIGETPATIRVVEGTFVVDSIEFPGNVTLTFSSGGRLYVPDGGFVEIGGAVEAGITRIFAGEGEVRGRIDNLHVFPQWFGAKGDGKTDDSAAVQRAADLAAGASGRTLFIPDGEYVFFDDIVFRCNVESRGLLVKEIEIDHDRTQFSHDIFLPTHHPVRNPHIYFRSDHSAVALDPEPFFGIEEGELEVGQYEEVPLAGGGGTIDLKQGGVLRFYSSDFFTSRRVRKGDRFYDRNDVVQLVSDRGAVFPEFAFSYPAPPDAAEWREDQTYEKGDYCTWEGRVFKATWPSGEGSFFEHAHYGRIDIGPVRPQADAPATRYEFEYEDGPADHITPWRRVEMRVEYREKDVPLTVNGLRVEVRLKNNDGRTKRIHAGAVVVNRSNMTFNNLEISVRDREATMARLLNSRECVNVGFNNSYFSGATSHHLGYNILNSNIANFRYNHCVSTNSRKGLDGRHGKNVTINGGYYNVIDDHYGRNYTIRDVTVSGLTTMVPGGNTPDADLDNWGFRRIRPFGFSGANLHIENVTVDNGAGGLLAARSDVGDLYGKIVLRDISVRRNEGDVTVFNHWIDGDFDYAKEVRTPDRLIVEDVTLENPGRVGFNIGSGFEGGAYGPVDIRNTGPIGEVSSSSEAVNFSECAFEATRFDVAEGALVNFRNSVFSGSGAGLSEGNIGKAIGNVKAKGADLSFPIEYINPAIYQDGD